MCDGVDWSYYDAQKFESANDKYLVTVGEGTTMATQICVAINKLIYKWYNDGDVFDNTYGMIGWANDLSSFANWLYKHVSGAKEILLLIKHCCVDADYEKLLQKLADSFLNLDFLNRYATAPKIDSIYSCDGPFVYYRCDDDPEDGWDDEWEEVEEGEEYD